MFIREAPLPSGLVVVVTKWSGPGEMSVANLADHVFEACRKAATYWPKGCAEILELLSWMTDDDAEITCAVAAWLESLDKNRVEVALEIEGWLPFRHPEEMDAVLAIIKARWPDLAATCARRRDQWSYLPRSSPDTRPSDLVARLAHFEALLRRVVGNDDDHGQR